MGPKITINGDVNAKIDGNGLFANGGSAKLTINGGGNIEINKDNTYNYYALLHNLYHQFDRQSDETTIRQPALEIMVTRRKR